MKYVKVENGKVVQPPYTINEQLEGYMPVVDETNTREFGDDTYDVVFGVSGDVVVRSCVYQISIPENLIAPVGVTV